MAIIVNERHVRERRRFSYAHEYAHALVDRRRVSASITSRQNSSELVERRANAFAGEFLLPAAGVAEVLSRLDKGGPSREVKWSWDGATGQGEHVERRNPPGSQTIGFQDVAWLANEFHVSYDMAVYRLSDMGCIGRADVSGLLDRREEGLKFLSVLRLSEPDQITSEHPRLEAHIGQVAAEAFRREMISGGRLLDVCEKLGINGEDLLALAQTRQ
jgi:Zn-dependent peptidase ImmA (M78 family)